eukprot:Phypoly_transcript_11887.p1 GENE.Phypoly_transcript_11887~~Phypoly_transcript_11887.p1  ORF type:complete len:280 (+),score=35.67 Phypoly_transcript_11887:119-958(+)
MASARDRCAGVLWGLAAGDKNGGPIRMAILLAESLVAQSGYDRDHVISKYNTWYLGKDTEPCFDTGNTFRSVFQYMRKGMDNPVAAKKVYDESPKDANAGVNAAHRAVPIAMAHSVTNVLSTTATEAAITHLSPISIQVAQVVNCIIRELILGHTWHDAIKHAKEIPGLHTDVLEALSGSTTTGGGYAPNVLQDAIFFVNQDQEPQKALGASLRFAGSSNFCPVLVGAFCGALCGRGGIKLRAKHELTHCSRKLTERMESVAQELAMTWPKEANEDLPT